MICIKCGLEFTSTRKNVVCSDCKQAHIESIGAIDAATNITADEMSQLKSVFDSWSFAAQMMLDGKSLSDISKYMGLSKQQTSLFFSRHIRSDVRKEKLNKKGAKQISRPIKFNPVWPENLYCAVFSKKEFAPTPQDVDEAVLAAIETLAQREQRIVFMRFRDECSLGEIGEEFGLTRERIRQIANKSIRKLRSRDASGFLIYGFSEWNEMRKREAAELAEKREMEKTKSIELVRRIGRDAGIDELNLDVRSHNCLYGAGLRQIEDIVSMTEDDLTKIDKLGRKSAERILNAVAKFVGKDAHSAVKNSNTQTDLTE